MSHEPFTVVSRGLRLAGDLYLPESLPATGVPATVVGSGFGGVKEMLLAEYGQALAAAGVACLAIDYPNFGASEGPRRQHIDPPAFVQAYTDALAALAVDPRIDSNRYYFRTREALIDAAVTRLVELDDADLSAVLPPTATHGTDVLGDLFARWSSPESRVRLAARFELLLSERLHDGRHPLHEARQHFTERARVGLTAAGVADVKLKTLTLIALFDGLLLDVLISGGANRDSAYRILAELQQGLSGAG